jgi:hypothetical protein
MDIVIDDNVPEGHVWLDAPGPDRRTIRYVVDLRALIEHKEKVEVSGGG